MYKEFIFEKENEIIFKIRFSPKKYLVIVKE